VTSGLRLVRKSLALLLSLTAASAAAEERIRVRLGGEGARIEDLRLEDYVAGVVAGEMPASFPPEALKAQAVAARSYALTRKLDVLAASAGRGWDIGNGVIAQVYRSGAGAAARAAVEATAGEVLVHGMEPVEAYFHAACGGRTEAGLPALGRDLPYLVPVECSRCEQAPGSRWRVVLGAAQLGRVAGLEGDAEAVRVAARSETGRVVRVELGRGRRTVVLDGADLRRRLGFSRLPSLAFEVRAADGGFVFEGRGLGHGAGLCQWGAAALAREGKTYREILAHFYPGTDVVRMY
jgi:stage II sporulation protein D